MVTSNDLRWPVGLHGTPPRSGKVLDYEKFDAPFFSVHGKQAQVSLACNQAPSLAIWQSIDVCAAHAENGPPDAQAA